jgi:uncharacterized membrane protein YedE/YeeE
MMVINWTDFTPFASFGGGVLIGLAALILMLAKGRVMGVSGILAGLLSRPSGVDWAWRLVFVIGTLLGPLLLVAVRGGTEIEVVQVAEGGQLWLAAFLVGLGTAIGSGCTSGHGICGLARFSLRSLAAVLTFVATGVATVFVTLHMLG